MTERDPFWEPKRFRFDGLRLIGRIVELPKFFSAPKEGAPDNRDGNQTSKHTDDTTLARSQDT